MLSKISCVHRALGLDDSALSAVVSRWATRLSAVFLQDNTAVLRSAGKTPRRWSYNAANLSGPFAHVVPEGDSVYELSHSCSKFPVANCIARFLPLSLPPSLLLFPFRGGYFVSNSCSNNYQKMR